jgi:hypothetical protein
VHEPAKRIVKLKLAPVPVLDLEPNPAACDKYGGCFFRGKQCKLDDQTQFKGLVKKMNQYEEKLQMGLLDKIKADQAKTANGNGNSSAPKSEAPPAIGTGRVNPPEASEERPAARAKVEEKKEEPKAEAKAEIPAKSAAVSKALKTSSHDEDAALGAAIRVVLAAGGRVSFER